MQGGILMAMHPAEDRYIGRTETGMAVGRWCKLCKFSHTRRKPTGMMVGNVGRGNGMREGNRQRGILIQHLKTEHPKEYAEAMAARSKGDKA
jgi:hypothetical protein